MKSALAASAVLSIALPCAAQSTMGGVPIGEGPVLLVGVVVAVLDVGFVISDVSKAGHTEVPSVGHGVGELLLALPQIALAGVALSDSITHARYAADCNVNSIALSSVWLALSAGMAAHAVWTFASQGRANPNDTTPVPGAGAARTPPDALAAGRRPTPLVPQLLVAPTFAEAGHQRGPGLAAVVRF